MTKIDADKKTAILSMLFAAYAVLLIADPSAAAEGVKTSLLRCINVIVPSLFAFMAVSALIVKSGAYIYISKLFSPLSRIIGLPKELFFVFFTANTAGYPLGASMIKTLVDNGRLDKKSAARLLCCCFNGGPAFFCSAVGLTVFSSQRAGMLIYCSILISNIILAALLNRLFPIKYSASEQKAHFDAQMLDESVSAAGESMLKICAMIMLFGTFIPYADRITAMLGIKGNAACLISSVIEISNLSRLEGYPFRLLPAVSAAGSFGGICILMQLVSIIRSGFSMKPFMAARVVSALLSALVCSVLYRHFGNFYVSASTPAKVIVNFNNFLPSICLIMMIFLSVLKKRVAFSKQVCYN